MGRKRKAKKSSVGGVAKSGLIPYQNEAPYEGTVVGEGNPFDSSGQHAPLDPGNPPTPQFRSGDAARFSIHGQVNSTDWSDGRAQYGLIPARVLDRLAETNDVLQCGTTMLLNNLSGLEWAFVAREQSEDGSINPVVEEVCRQLEEFFETPDRRNGQAWPEWIKGVMRAVLVADNLTIEPNYDRLGRPHSLLRIDGKTIQPLIDNHGHRPAPPYPAYVQYIRGQATELFTTHELYYKPTEPRDDAPYGRSAVEKIFTHVLTGVREWETMLQATSEDTTPRVWFETPEGWTDKQVKAWLDLVNDTVAANRGRRFKAHPIPRGSNIHQVSELVWTREKQEWLARVVCAVLGVNPTPFLAIVNRATAETMETIQQDSGVQPWKNTLAQIINDLVRICWGPQVSRMVRFDWVTDRTEVSEARVNTLKTMQIMGWMRPSTISEQAFGQDPDDDIRALPLGFDGSRPEPAVPAVFGELQTSGPELSDPAQQLGPEISLNELTLAIERFKSIGDLDMVNLMRRKAALVAGAPPPPPLKDISSEVQDEIVVEQATTDAPDPAPAPPASSPEPATKVDDEAAPAADPITEGIRDLQRWQKVVKRHGVDSGRARKFASDVIPDEVRDIVQSGLEAAGKEFQPEDVFAIAKARLTNRRDSRVDEALERIQRAALEMLEEQEPELVAQALADYRSRWADVEVPADV